MLAQVTLFDEDDLEPDRAFVLMVNIKEPGSDKKAAQEGRVSIWGLSLLTSRHTQNAP